MLRSSILHSVLAEHGEPAGTFACGMTYLVAPSGQTQALAGPALAGTVRNTYSYKSYAAFAADVAAGRAARHRARGAVRHREVARHPG